MEAICLQMITCVGSAKSCFVEAIGLAREHQLEAAYKKIEEGDGYFSEGHHAHGALIAQEAGGDPVAVSLILMHAEDQLMSAETARIYTTEFVALYQQLQKAHPPM